MITNEKSVKIWHRKNEHIEGDKGPLTHRINQFGLNELCWELWDIIYIFKVQRHDDKNKDSALSNSLFVCCKYFVQNAIFSTATIVL